MTSDREPETKTGKKRPTMEGVSQIADYGQQLGDLLDRVGATIEAYKFSVEKKDEAFVIDVAVRASFHPKSKAGATESE